MATGLTALSGCVPRHQGPRVHFATASEEQLKSLQEEDVVWFEFREGDPVPLRFVLIGVVEGINEDVISGRARRTFYIVTFKDKPTQFSFDGQTLAQEAGKAAIILGNNEGNNEAAIVIYTGPPGEAPSELQQ